MKKHMRKYLIIIILVMIVALATFSYSLFIITDKQTNNNILNSTCLSFEIKNEQNEISLQNAFPLLDEEGKKLTPYTFTVKNTCDAYMSYTISLETLQGSTLANKYVKVMLNNEAIANLDTLPSNSTYYYDGAIASKILGTYALGTDEEEDFSLRIWMDGDATANEETMNKVFNSKIVIKATIATFDPVENGITTLHDAILANEYQITDVELAKQKIEAKQTVDTSKTAPIIDWQENVSSAPKTGVTSSTLPAKSLIGSSFDVTENETKVRFGNSYKFNSETGYYTICNRPTPESPDSECVTSNLQYYDPEEVNYNDGNYYYCSTGYNISNADKISTYWIDNCPTMYRITGVSPTATESTNSLTQTKFATTKYTFNGYTLNQVELESDKSDRGLYAAQDDYGTTYYYRGSVKNNYVYFANAYWQIIRINGDKSIRMIYAGTKPNATGSDTYIKSAAFNTDRDNPAYVGYMYGKTLDTSLAQTNANEVSSNAKTELENWYKTNIEDAGLSSLIADSGFCNDRTLSSQANNGNGYATNVTTYYAPYYRYYTSKTPTFVCSNNENDLFTVSNEKGNKAATYPIGLVTVDELMYAGFATGYMNRLTYLYQNGNYWSMSPFYFRSGSSSAYEFLQNATGNATHDWVPSGLGLRPVINLQSDVTISGGVGTNDNPYVVVTS